MKPTYHGLENSESGHLRALQTASTTKCIQQGECKHNECRGCQSFWQPLGPDEECIRNCGHPWNSHAVDPTSIPIRTTSSLQPKSPDMKRTELDRR
jgi:hypothetical protein